MTRQDFTLRGILALMSNPAMCVGQRLDADAIISTALKMAEKVEELDVYCDNSDADDRTQKQWLSEIEARLFSIAEKIK